MKILVLSDSHSGISFMRFAIQKTKPDICIHLGDYYDDGQTLAEQNPGIRFLQVPGNCDRHRMVRYEPEVRCYGIGGVKVYMTHGHVQRVKETKARLLAEAREMGAQAVLYGHTHIADCHREDDGLWVMNPGACGSYGGSVGVMEIHDGVITDCKILHLSDLEEIV